MHQISIELFHMLRATIEQGGYWLIFCVSLVEGIPLLGSLIPGNTLIGVGGFFAHLGVLNVWYVTILAIMGAVVGDIFGYILGKKYGYDTLVALGKYFLIKKEHIDKAKGLVAKHTGKSILIGRFNPVTRSLMPFVVGSSGVRMKLFWFYDLIGCCTWIVGTVALGYISGAGYLVVAKFFGSFVLVGLIIVLLLVWGYRFINTRAHIFRRYELGTLIVVLLAVFGFFLTLQDVLNSHSFMANLDVWVNSFAATKAIEFSSILRTVSVILSPFLFSLCAIVFAFYLLITKKWSRAFLVLASFGGGFLINTLLKLLVGRVRPENALITLTDYSFPSGHAIAGAMFFFLCIYFFTKKFKHLIARELFVTVCCFLILLTGAARVFLNVHWLSDVTAGITLGLLWTGLMVLFTRFIDRVMR
ncbi:MAG: bifunctional DedA family/phosphatase PAP2 family protein [Candidatus Taylorbacteria bacterium]|nr:bifunctional DedA family/phosphatase PAP2 family protein [Candidatus Taylorbacteria bacterium]